MIVEGDRGEGMEQEGVIIFGVHQGICEVRTSVEKDPVVDRYHH